MVDPTKGIGPVQGFQPAGNSKTPKKTDGAVSTAAPKDEVKLSEKALSLSQAEDTAKNTREALSNSNYHLGLNPSFDEKV